MPQWSAFIHKKCFSLISIYIRICRFQRWKIDIRVCICRCHRNLHKPVRHRSATNDLDLWISERRWLPNNSENTKTTFRTTKRLRQHRIGLTCLKYSIASALVRVVTLLFNKGISIEYIGSVNTLLDNLKQQFFYAHT